MSYIVSFVATRTDTSKDFFYDVEAYQQIMSDVQKILEGLIDEGVLLSHEHTYSDDKLICTRKAHFINRDSFFSYLTALNRSFPTLMIVRNTYFIENNHSLYLEWIDSEVSPELQKYVLVS